MQCTPKTGLSLKAEKQGQPDDFVEILAEN
jgi:hypothetical protein